MSEQRTKAGPLASNSSVIAQCAHKWKTLAVDRGTSGVNARDGDEKRGIAWSGGDYTLTPHQSRDTVSRLAQEPELSYDASTTSSHPV